MKIKIFSLFILVLAIFPLKLFAQNPDGIVSKNPDSSISKPPHVSEAEGWKKYSIRIFTSCKEDKKEIWLKGGLDKTKRRLDSSTYVIRCSESGNAIVWADLTGVHYFDPKINKVNTPIDLSYRNYKFGPRIDYTIVPSSTGSYLTVKWGDADKKTVNGKEEWTGGWYVVLLSPTGEILWKHSEKAPLKKMSNTKCIDLIKPSNMGKMLAFINEGCGEDSLGPVEIWNGNGQIIKSLPKFSMEFYWIKGGLEIYYQWKEYPHGMGGKSITKSAVFDEYGNWISGDS